MKKLLVGLMVLGLAATAGAEVILQYTFTGSVADPSTEASGVSGTAFANSQGSFGYGTATASTTTGGPTAPSVTTAGWSTAQNNYWSFSLTLNPGLELANTPDALSLSFTYRASGTGPTTYEWQYNSGSGWNSIASGAMTANSAWQPAINVAAGALAGLDGTIDFRLYGYGTTASAGTWAVDNVTLNGTVIPEPTTMVMMGIGLIGIVFARRLRS